MKFYLLENYPSSFRVADTGHIDVNGEQQAARTFSGFVPVEITPFDQSPSEINKCALLKTLLEKEIPRNRLYYSRRWEEFWTPVIHFGVSNLTHSDGRLMLPRGTRGDAFSKLTDLFEGITVQVGLKVLENEQDDVRVLTTVSSKEMTVLEGNGNLFESPMLFPLANFFAIRTLAVDPPVYARVTLTVTIPDDIITQSFGIRTLNQKILEDGALTDVTIVCSDGKIVQAHRNFLAARSSVFLAMFQMDMKEARESTVEIPDMVEKYVRALLKYLYYDDTKDAEEEFRVALELFIAGHKYAVQWLEGKMKEQILKKPNDQIDMEGALKLFLFARNLIPAEEELMKKAAKILERYSNNLQNSPEMQQLFRTDHQAALELLEYAYKRN